MSELPIVGHVNDLKDEKVYGVDIKTYEVNGVEGLGFLEAAAFASLRQSHTLEAATRAVSEVVKLRQKKATDLGEALAIIAEAVASMNPEENDPEKESSIDTNKLKEANAILKRYGIAEMSLKSSGQVSYDQAYYKQNDVQLVLDNVNNDLQQNMASLQGYVSKRDNAFIIANKIVAKVNVTAIDTIHAFGM